MASAMIIVFMTEAQQICYTYADLKVRVNLNETVLSHNKFYFYTFLSWKPLTYQKTLLFHSCFASFTACFCTAGALFIESSNKKDQHQNKPGKDWFIESCSQFGFYCRINKSWLQNWWHQCTTLLDQCTIFWFGNHHLSGVSLQIKCAGKPYEVWWYKK